MAIVVGCPGCGQTIRAPDSFAGKKIRCPKCGASLRVVPREEPLPELEEEEKVFSPPPRARPPGPRLVRGPPRTSSRQAPPPEESLDELPPLPEDVFAETPEEEPSRPGMRGPFLARAARGALAPPGRVAPLGSSRALASTRPWVLFLSILGFVFCGFQVLALLLVVGGVAAVSRDPSASGAALLVGILTFGPGAAVSGVLSWLLFAYARAIRDYVKSGQPAALEKALVAQRNFWMVAGIVVAIALAIGLIPLLGLFAALLQAPR